MTEIQQFMKAPRKIGSWAIPACLLCFLVPSAFSQGTTYSITPNPATVSESAGTFAFTITRSGSLPAELLLASTTTSESFSNNNDYRDITRQPVNFLPGETSRMVSVTITNDTAIEDNETFGFIVQRNASDPVTTYLAKSTFTITDDDLAQATYFVLPEQVDEGSDHVTLSVIRSEATAAARVEFRTTPTEGYTNDFDYEDVQKTLDFPAGVFLQSVSVGIFDDTTPEKNEVFGVILLRSGSGSGTNLLAKSTFTILDNDGPIAPRILNPRLAGSTFTLSVDSQADFNYVLDYKNTLTRGIWTPVQTNTGNGGIISLTNTGVTGSSRIYRVHVQY